MTADVPPDVLPDVLAPDLDIVFCGTAPGAVSARRQAYYAGPGNLFWPTLYEVRLTPVLIQPLDYRNVSRWNLGFTDLAKTVFGSDAELRPGHFDRSRLHDVIERYKPRIVAFTSKRAAMEFMGRDVVYGPIPESGTASVLFVLPSPSGRARRFWSRAPWEELAALRRSIVPRTEMDGGLSPP